MSVRPGESGDRPWFAALTAEGAPRWLQTASGEPRVAIDGDGGVIAVFGLWNPRSSSPAGSRAPHRASLIFARRGPEGP